MLERTSVPIYCCQFALSCRNKAACSPLLARSVNRGATPETTTIPIVMTRLGPRYCDAAIANSNAEKPVLLLADGWGKPAGQTDEVRYP